MVWHTHLLKSCPQFVVICKVKSFSTVNKAETYVFLELSCFCTDPIDVGNWISAFAKYSMEVHSSQILSAWNEEL